VAHERLAEVKLKERQRQPLTVRKVDYLLPDDPPRRRGDGLPGADAQTLGDVVSSGNAAEIRKVGGALVSEAKAQISDADVFCRVVLLSSHSHEARRGIFCRRLW